MKKNGFVFIETIVVTGFLITSLMVLYTLFVATNNRETRKLRYDDPPKIYETYYLYRYLESFKLSDLVDNLKEGKSNYETIYRSRANLFSDYEKESAFFENMWAELHVEAIYLIPSKVSEIITCPKGKYTTICTDQNLMSYLNTLDDDDENVFYFVVEYKHKKDGSTCEQKDCFYYFSHYKISTGGSSQKTGITTITDLVKDANTKTTDVYTVPDKTSDSCTYTLAYDGTSDNNLRYVGANPCNYVKIDNEIWRIIGLMNNIDDGTGKKETRIKLIRNESIGSYSWDTSESSVNNGYGVNEWSQADLMKLLNPGYESESVGGSLYYNGGSGNCYYNYNNGTTSCDFTSSGLKTNLKSLIDDTLWNTGTNGTNSYYSSSNGLASHFYDYERSSNTGKICTSGDFCNDTVARTTTWNGKIGLMYPSDYGYATSGGSTSNRTSCLGKELSSYSDCMKNDWLLDTNTNDWQWTLSPHANSIYADRVFHVYTSGSVGNYYANHSWAVRPSVYLISKTSILGGEGTLENPYEIG